MSTTTLEDFFVRFRESEGESADRLATFFRDFDADFHKARIIRATSTPHLDVLRVFGLEFAELRHSAALAWFLSSRAEHEQGSLFVNALLELFKPDIKTSDRYTVQREQHERTDVAVFARGEFAVFVENKVRHSEREMQVADMVKSLAKVSTELEIPREHRFALFLTDTGVKPVTGPDEDSKGFSKGNLKSISRVELFEHFRSALTAQSIHSPLLLAFIESYLNSIRRIRAQLS